jgi:hypothetical protein
MELYVIHFLIEGGIGAVVIGWIVKGIFQAGYQQRDTEAIKETIRNIQNEQIKAATITELAVKVNTIWDFTIRRGYAIGESKGVLRTDSPITITEVARKAFKVIENDLHCWYLEEGFKYEHERDFIVALEKKFGARLTEEVCRLNEWTSAECLLAAAVVAKESVGESLVMPEIIPKTAEK